MRNRLIGTLMAAALAGTAGLALAVGPAAPAAAVVSCPDGDPLIFSDPTVTDGQLNGAAANASGTAQLALNRSGTTVTRPLNNDGFGAESQMLGTNTYTYTYTITNRGTTPVVPRFTHNTFGVGFTGSSEQDRISIAFDSTRMSATLQGSATTPPAEPAMVSGVTYAFGTETAGRDAMIDVVGLVELAPEEVLTFSITSTRSNGTNLTREGPSLQPGCVTVGSMSLTKTATLIDADDNGLADVGETISYSYTLLNNGGLPLANAVVTETDADFDGTGTVPVPTRDSGDGVLAIDESETWTANYTLTVQDIAAGEVSNQARASALSPGGNAVSAVSDNPATGAAGDATVLSIAKEAQLSIVKAATPRDTDNDGQLEVGEVIDYAFTITNNGNAPATGVEITDPNATVSGGPITLAADATDATTFTATHVITAADIAEGSVTNQATAGWTNPGGSTGSANSTPPGGGTGSTVTPIEEHTAMSLLESATFNDENGNGTADPGETITYKYTLTNTGNVPVSGITVTNNGQRVPGGPITLEPGTVDSTTFSLNYTITAADIAKGSVSSQSSATGFSPGNPDGFSTDSAPASGGTGPTVVRLTATPAPGTGLAETGFELNSAGMVAAFVMMLLGTMMVLVMRTRGVQV